MYFDVALLNLKSSLTYPLPTSRLPASQCQQELPGSGPAAVADSPLHCFRLTSQIPAPVPRELLHLFNGANHLGLMEPRERVQVVSRVLKGPAEPEF